MHQINNLISVYIGGLVAGLAIIIYPASASYIIDTIGLSGEQYGSIFLPKIVLGIIGALVSGALVRRISLKSMWLGALVCNLLSQILLVLALDNTPSTAFNYILVSAAFFGFAFGFGGGPINAIAALSFPKHSATALTMLHVFVGVGMCAAPLIVAFAIRRDSWSTVPIIFAILAALACICTIMANTPQETGEQELGDNSPSKSLYFWVFILIAILFALAEGTFVNWGVVYVEKVKSLPIETAALSLSVFMAMVTAGRFIAAFLLLRLKPAIIWLLSPPLMFAAFLLFPMLQGDMAVFFGFALAGLSCSIFFPLMLIVATETYPNSVSFVASILMAAILFGACMSAYVIGKLQSGMSLDSVYTNSAILPVILIVLIFISFRLSKNIGALK